MYEQKSLASNFLLQMFPNKHQTLMVNFNILKHPLNGIMYSWGPT